MKHPLARALALSCILISCADSGREVPRAPDSQASASATEGVPGGAPFGSRAPTSDTVTREIYIDSVFAGNPVVVYGRARTFENTVQVRARDARGAQMTEVFTTSTGEMGHHNPFSASVFLTRDPGAHFTVEAFEYSAKDGSVRSLTSRQVAVAGARTRVTLAFATSDCAVTKDFTREVPTTLALARLLVEALVAGPTSEERASGASSVFPAGARVQSVNLRDGQLTVDFNERLQNVGGACAAQAIRTSVTATMSRLPSVKGVAITAGGSAAKALQP